jgi:hypothetical protein
MAASDGESHEHDALVHDHEHWHVTHNWDESAQDFEHLAARHAHTHDHASVTHSHVPHEDVESEHLGEAHIHDHDEPVDAAAGAARGTSP